VIRGWFDPDSSDHPLPMIAGLVSLPGIAEDWTLAYFLFDTGSASTTIHPHDAIERLQIQVERLRDPVVWTRRETVRGIGGSALSFITSARYAFLDDAGDWQIVEAQIRVAQPTPSNLGLPSILGWDILRRFTVHLDWSRKSVELG
jgi:hypothetical protein